jgi:hypothetical protein
MRHSPRVLLVALTVGFVLQAVPGRAQTSATEHPMGFGKLSLVDGPPNRRRVTLQGQWSGKTALKNPAAVGATLRVAGTGEGDGDSGVIQLLPDHWRGLGKKKGGFRYSDPKGRAGGVRSIVLHVTKKGGTLRVVGGRSNWRYVVDRPQSGIVATLTIGETRWCAEFTGTFPKNKVHRVVAASKTAPASCPCNGFRATWPAIQSLVIERHGCTNNACHGTAASGGLVLTPDVAYHNLVDVPSSSVPGRDRVEPGDKNLSVLWLKLAKATKPDEYANAVPGAGMPNGGLAPLSDEELEAVRLWIQSGAPETGVVPETAKLLSSCLPPADPLKIRPAPAPAVGEGLQFHAPPWSIPPRDAAGKNGENEVCYATYYDRSADIPDSAKVECPEFWGGVCTGGTRDKQPCDLGAISDPCGGGTCGRRQCYYTHRNELTQDPNSHHSIISIYNGGGSLSDFGPFTCNGGAQNGQACDPLVPGACAAGECTGNVQRATACIGYGPADLQTHSPNIGGSQQPHLDQEYPPGVFGLLPTAGIIVWNSHAFNVTDRVTTNEQYLNEWFSGPSDRVSLVDGIFDTSQIFVQNVPPFEKREYCSTHTLPQGAQVFQLSSHTHKRGKLFRIWGPGITPCTPGPSCNAETSTPIGVTTQYSDPVQVRYDPPLALDDPDPASRTYKYCTIYDNGADDASTVKRWSTSPFSFVGGKCSLDTIECLNGPHTHKKCGTAPTAAERDSLCDSSNGAGDGVCDACPLRGGVTTEDEMFILLGLYYCPPGTTCHIPFP